MPQEQGSAILSLVGAIFLFILVLLLAYLTTRWLGRRYGSQKAGGRIRILERTAIGPDRLLVIVRVEEKVWLLGVTSHQISSIGELDPELFEDEELFETEHTGIFGMAHLPQLGKSDFAKTLQDALKGWTGKKEEKDKRDE